MALIMWLIMGWSCLLSYTDHVPREAINKKLIRYESKSQQAMIMELRYEESCCSAGNNQAAEQAGITQHSWQLSSRWQAGIVQLRWQLSSRWADSNHAAQQALITWLSMYLCNSHFLYEWFRKDLLWLNRYSIIVFVSHWIIIFIFISWKSI